MPEKKKQPAAAKTATKVTRIKATSTKKKTVKKVAAPTTNARPQKTSSNPLAAIGGYFKGAWEELLQVRWPSRRTTWGLTLAVIAFTLFFVVLIVLLDLVFQWLFDQMIG